uniref:Uncharacterized protein n=1 Tax=Florenciella sp. virus SA2 TaxID=3240092 RepID=A0AB39J6P3_9VIRU
MKKKNKSKSKIFQYLYKLNNSKFFAGIIMLIMNIGSKYISIELSKSQEDYIKYTIGRQILIFAILWMGTRDIVISLILTCIFILFADYLFNDTSYFCILPNKNVTAEKENKPITKKEINDAINVLKEARKSKCLKDKSSVEDLYVKKGLYKENFI